MAVESFAALFFAHVIADYLLQTRWVVENKRRPLALGVHITLVYLCMILTTLTFSPWLLAIAAMHLVIDILKAYVLPGGVVTYTMDQILHVLSITLVVTLAPDLWAASPLAEIPNLPLIYLLAAATVFAARGGQFAVMTFLGNQGIATVSGGYLGWVERVLLCLATLAAGLFGALGVIALKLASLIPQSRVRTPENRQRLIWGAGVSLGWGVGTAIPLALLIPHLL